MVYKIPKTDDCENSEASALGRHSNETYDNVEIIADNIEHVNAVSNELDVITELHDNLPELLQVDVNAQAAAQSAMEASASASEASTSETNSEVSAVASEASATRAETAAQNNENRFQPLADRVTTNEGDINTLNQRNINTPNNSGLAGGGDLSDDRNLSVDISNTPATTVIGGTSELLMDTPEGLRRVTRDTLLQGVSGGLELRGSVTVSADASSLPVSGDGLNSSLNQGTAPSHGNGVNPNGFTYLIQLTQPQRTSGVMVNMGGVSGSPSAIHVFHDDKLVWTGDQWQHIETGDNVLSVHGRYGVVTSETGDYDSTQVIRQATADLPQDTVEAALVGLSQTQGVTQEQLLGINSTLFPAGVNTVAENHDGGNDDVGLVPANTTHLRIPINGKTEIVTLSPVSAGGAVSVLTENGCNIGGVVTVFRRVSISQKTTLTLSEAVSNAFAYDGLSVTVSDRGNGKFVYRENQTANTFNIVACTGVTNLSLVLIEGVYSFSDRYGVIRGDDVDSSISLKLWFDHCSTNNRKAFLAPLNHEVHIGIDCPSNLHLTGFPQLSHLDGTKCTRFENSGYLFGACDGVLCWNFKSNCSVSKIKITYPSAVAVPDQLLCGAMRIEGCSDFDVERNLFQTSVEDSDINLSCIGIDNGLNDTGERVKTTNLRIKNNTANVHSGFVVCKGRAPQGQPNDTRTNKVYINFNTVNVTQTTGGLSTTGIIKVDIWSKDVNVIGNICDGNNIAIGFIQAEENLDNILISANIINNCNSAGIVLFDGQAFGFVKNINVVGNILSEAGIFVNHSGTPNPLTENINLSNNVINGWSIGAGSAVAAISVQFLQASESIKISGNVVSDSARAFFLRAPDAIISNNEALRSLGDSFELQDAADSTLVGNVSKGGSGTCLVLVRSPNCSINGGHLDSNGSNPAISQSGTTAGGCTFNGVTMDTNGTNVIVTSGVTDGVNLLTGCNIKSGTASRIQDLAVVNNLVGGQFRATGFA